MKAYKLFRLRKDGSLGPLFINAKLRIQLNTWMAAEAHPTKGFAYRPGWHCCFTPEAPHLSEKGRVWAECEVANTITYKRPESQGGAWVLASSLQVLRTLTTDEVISLRNN